MRRATTGAFWAGLAVLLGLGLADLLRPGFLALGEWAGWGTLLLLVVPAALAGGLGAWFLPRREASRPPRRWLRVGALALAAALPLIGAVRSSASFSSEPRGDQRVIVLGVDGASWDQIGPMAERGELPSFARLEREGAVGVLASEEPTLSPRVWTTIASGVGPERHGAEDFLSTQESVRVPRMWEVVAAEGGRIGLFGWLLTWPPGTPEGFVVPGWLARGNDTWPPDLAFYQDLKGGGAERSGLAGLVAPAWQGYLNGLRLPTLLQAVTVKMWIKLTDPDDRTSTPRTLLLQSEMAADLFVYWMRRAEPELGALVLYAVDSFAHRYWGDFQPQGGSAESGRFRDVIPSAYRQADRTLGRLFDLADEKTVVMVISDHGTGPAKSSARRFSLRSERLAELLAPIAEVRAFSITDQVVLRVTEDDAGDESLAAIEAALRAVEVGGRPLLEVEETDADFLAVSLREDPDQDVGVTIAGQDVLLGDLVVESDFSGGHTTRGMVGVWGADVEPGSTLEGASLRDVAPTVLALSGYSVSAEMDGRPLLEALRPEIASSMRVRRVARYEIALPGRSGEAPEVDDAIRERLRALGYLE